MQEQLVIWFGETGATAARYVIAFAVVLLLLVALRWIVRRYMGGPAVGGARGRQPRLAVMDVAVVDARRRLVLVRRDNVEHLVMIGGPTDIVIEQTIVRGMPVGTMGRLAPRQAAQPEPAAQPIETELPAPTPPPRHATPRTGESATAAARPYQEQPVRPAAPARTAPEPASRPAPPAEAIPLRAPADVRTATPQRAPQPAPSPPAAGLAPRPQRPAEAAVRPATSLGAGAVASAVAPPLSAPMQRATAYIPPEHSTTDAARSAAAAPPVAPPEPLLRKPAAPPVPPIDPARRGAADAGGFDDLAQRLDEALRLDLEDDTPAPTRSEPPLAARPEPAPVPYSRPTRGPAARPDGSEDIAEASVTSDPRPSSTTQSPIAASQPPAPPSPAPVQSPAPSAPSPTPSAPSTVADRGAAALGAAGAWFKPRGSAEARPSEEPVAAARPSPPPAELSRDTVSGNAATRFGRATPAGAPGQSAPAKPENRDSLASTVAAGVVGAVVSAVAGSPVKMEGVREEAPKPEPPQAKTPEPVADAPVSTAAAPDTDFSSRFADDFARMLETEDLVLDTPPHVPDPDEPPVAMAAPVAVHPATTSEPPAPPRAPEIQAVPSEETSTPEAAPEPVIDTAFETADSDSASAAPEPKAPEVQPEAKAETERAKTGAPADSDFSSLEDEMARLLDELAGDTKTRG